jgi:hypothetical protein
VRSARLLTLHRHHGRQPCADSRGSYLQVLGVVNLEALISRPHSPKVPLPMPWSKMRSMTTSHMRRIKMLGESAASSKLGTKPTSSTDLVKGLAAAQ